MALAYHYNLIYCDLKDLIVNFSWKSEQSKAAIKAALACVTAILIANAIKLPYPFWSGMAPIVMMRTNVGAVFSKGWMRTCGCTIGCILTVFFLGFIIQSPILFSVFIFCGTFIGFYAGTRAKNSYFWFYMLINTVLIGIVTYSNPADNFPLEIAFARSTEVLLGVLSSWFYNIILWPNFASDNLDKEIVELFSKMLSFNKELVSQIYRSDFNLQKLELLKNPIAFQLNKCNSLLSSALDEKKLISKQSVDFKTILNTAEKRISTLNELFKLYSKSNFYQVPPNYNKLLKRILSYLNSMPSLSEYRTNKFLISLPDGSYMHNFLDRRRFNDEAKTYSSQSILFFYTLIYYLESSLKDLTFICQNETNKIVEEKKLNQESFSKNEDYLTVSLFSTNLYFYKSALINAVKGGLSLLCIFWFFLWINLPGFLNIAVSIVVLVGTFMNVMDSKHKGYLRLIGCLLGAAIGLVFLRLSIDSSFIYFLLTFCVVLALCYVGGAKPGVSYIGLQSVIAFLICVATDFKIETQFGGVIERLTGIFIALILIWVINNIILPDDFISRLKIKISKVKESFDNEVGNLYRYAKDETTNLDASRISKINAECRNILTLLQICEYQNDLPSEKLMQIKEKVLLLQSTTSKTATMESYDIGIRKMFNELQPKLLRHFFFCLSHSLRTKSEKGKERLNDLTSALSTKVFDLTNSFINSDKFKEIPVSHKIDSSRFLLYLGTLHANLKALSDGNPFLVNDI